MKTIIFVAGLALGMAFPSYAAEEKKAPEIKTVCVDVQGKDGKAVIDPKTKKPKQNCTKVKVRQKHEGTKIEDAKKK
jgi:esterase/lipase